LDQKTSEQNGAMMNEFTLTMSMVLGILLRIGIPVGLTFLLASFLRRLDAKWRKEASQAQPGETILRELWLSYPCWDEMNCEEEKPCWEIFLENGKLNSKCQACEYRKELLLPIRINVETSRR
jgi:hypothetical protein